MAKLSTLIQKELSDHRELNKLHNVLGLMDNKLLRISNMREVIRLNISFHCWIFPQLSWWKVLIHSWLLIQSWLFSEVILVEEDNLLKDSSFLGKYSVGFLNLLSNSMLLYSWQIKSWLILETQWLMLILKNQLEVTYWRMQAQRDFISEREKDNKESVKFLIHLVWLKTRQFSRSLKEVSLIRRIEITK